MQTKLPMLDSRLQLAAQQIRQGVTVADIGCDHGKLSAFIAANCNVNKVVAVDINKAPLQKAEKLIYNAGLCNKAECRLGNGLAALQPYEAQDIVIAGMSGITISLIINAADWVKNKDVHFVLVPASKDDYLRQWLYSNGFCIISENAAAAQGRFYTVITAAYCGVKQETDAKFNFFGYIIDKKDNAALGYKKKILNRLEREYNGRQKDSRYSAKQVQDILDIITDVSKNNM